MKQWMTWKVLGPVGLGSLAVMAMVSSCAGTTGITGGGAPVNTSALAAQGTNGGAIAHTISVNGYGEASGTPDIAYVTVAVSVTNPDVGKAVTENNTRMQAVKQALLAAGIAEEDLQTVGFSVWPEDKYDPQTGTTTGDRVYHVDNSLNIKVRDLSKAGSVIETALDAGANSVGGLSFGVEDTDALEAAARKDAVDDAHGRAQQLADALGVTLGEPLIVTEGGAPIAQPIPMMAADSAVGAGGGGAPPISAGQLTVSSSVYIVYSIGQ